MNLLDVVYPKVCPVCGKLIPLQHTFCDCSRQPIRYVNDDTDYADADALNPLNHFTAPFYYDGVIRAQLLSLKFQQQTSLAKPLGLAMAERVTQMYPDVSFDCVTFVPITKEDIRNRSFNQSALLAQIIARALFIPCVALLKKDHATLKQHTLNQKERLRNLDQAFSVTNRFKAGQTVLLCDDIKTTGTTLYQCSRVLLNNGANDVYCVCCAMSDYQQFDF